MFSLEKVGRWGLAKEGLKGVYLRLVFVDKKWQVLSSFFEKMEGLRWDLFDHKSLNLLYKHLWEQDGKPTFNPLIIAESDAGHSEEARL